MIHSIRAGRESSKVNLDVVEECEPSEKQNSEQKKPLPFDEVDEIVKQFYKNNKMLWMDSNSGWKYLQSKYSPTRMPAHSFQNAKDCSALQRQAEVHLNVAALLSAFAFSAAASEGAQSSAKFIVHRPSHFYRPLACDYTISRHSIAFYVHRHGTWQQRWLSLLAGLLRKTRYVVRHVSCWMLVACCIFPNVGIPQVQRSACFFCYPYFCRALVFIRFYGTPTLP